MEEFLLMIFQKESGVLGHLNMVAVKCTRHTEFAGQMKNQGPGQEEFLAGHTRPRDVPPAPLASVDRAEEGEETPAVVTWEEAWSREHHSQLTGLSENLR